MSVTAEIWIQRDRVLPSSTLLKKKTVSRERISPAPFRSVFLQAILTYLSNQNLLSMLKKRGSNDY